MSAYKINPAHLLPILEHRKSSNPEPYSWQLYTAQGLRKYVSLHELRSYMAAVKALPRDAKCFCELVALTGCRISEALEMCAQQVSAGEVVLRTLKRRKLVHRCLQVPEWLTEGLAALGDGNLPTARLWRVSRATAYRWIKMVMRLARIHGNQASPKGLRHGFGVRYALAKVPLSVIQKWMGHSSPKTTAVYLDAVGLEEREFARAGWV